ASAIAAELEKMEFSRPMTHDLIASVVKNMSLKVLKVEIVDIKDNVYYATLHVDNGEEIRKIDSRPSDAIAVALRTSAPIFVHEDVLKNSKHIKFDQDAIKKGLSEGSSLDVLEELSPDAFGKYKM
ncbi:MAG: bifunctional nuclease family protein, partial [Deltaproteobacteria bacterium]|nr:bifunctional nuclease family protein [Deltaproteobacteria bacterium]